jgi:uncharacterized protein YqjF (DUF2071 family)
MTQSWHDLLFAHWPVDPGTLRGLVPAAFELDLWEGQAWVGIVPFRMSNVAPRAVPALPWVSAFPELNVRTYVRAAGRGGVCFFSLDASNPLAVGVARTLAKLPYYSADMQVDEQAGWISYRSRRKGIDAKPVEFVARYRPVGPVQPPLDGTLEHFLTERYCLFTTDNASHAYTLGHSPSTLAAADR